MLRKCVMLYGEIINIGDWDYQIQEVELKPARYDEEGNFLEEAICDSRITNPLPEGAKMVEIEIDEGPDGGLYPAGYTFPKTPEQQRISELESEAMSLVLELTDTQTRLQHAESKLDQSEADHASLLLELVSKEVI